jgi:hypothetical protein
LLERACCAAGRIALSRTVCTAIVQTDTTWRAGIRSIGVIG